MDGFIGSGDPFSSKNRTENVWFFFFSSLLLPLQQSSGDSRGPDEMGKRREGGAGASDLRAPRARREEVTGGAGSCPGRQTGLVPRLSVFCGSRRLGRRSGGVGKGRRAPDLCAQACAGRRRPAAAALRRSAVRGAAVAGGPWTGLLLRASFLLKRWLGREAAAGHGAEGSRARTPCGSSGCSTGGLSRVAGSQRRWQPWTRGAASRRGSGATGRQPCWCRLESGRGTEAARSHVARNWTRQGWGLRRRAAEVAALARQVADGSTVPRRIAEVKEKERHKALEEIIYCMVIQKFMENGISMIPTIAPSSDPTIQVDAWPNQERKLEAVHSQDALDMIESHISLILGERSVGPLNTVGQISKIKLGKLYAASIMYGYFLKRVDERFQLERTMKTLPLRTDNRETIFDSLKANPLWDVESLVQIPSDEDDDIEGGGISGADEKSKSSRLRSYVMYFDAETLQRYATIRSKEAISLIEKQTQALFGRPDIRVAYDGSIEIPNDEIISITFSGLTMLVLEAVAFGSFLWDAEGYVESKHHFVAS